MGYIGETAAKLGERSIGLCDALTKDIEAGRFARLAAGADGAVQANHPAWVVGHLALYPARVLGMAGDEPGDAAVPETWGELFGHGSELHDDPGGSIYPAKSELMETYNRAYSVMFDRIRAIDDQVMHRETPEERFRAVFPTVGALASFLASGHQMFHLGQLSTWRRCEGLGSVM